MIEYKGGVEGFMGKVKHLSYTSLLAATAIAITVLGISKYLRFPILTYLTFDPAEIPTFIALLVLNVKYAFMVAIAHYAFLLWFGGWTPIGPTMKFLAVSSMLLGWQLGKFLSKRTVVKIATASIARAVIMLIANVIVLLFIYPNFISIISKILGTTSTYETLLIMLLLTSIYNVLHVVFDFSISKIIVERINKLKNS